MNATPPVSILLVDDRPANLLALRAVLEPLGEKLLEAASGDAALELAASHDLAVILLDVQMPGMDGFETAARLRNLDPDRRTPILFVTAAALDEQAVARGYALGAVDYVLKPFTPELLRHKVAAYVEAFRLGRALETRLESLAPALEPPLVLLVNDNAATLLALCEALAPLDCKVLTAESSSKALSLLLSRDVALLLLDFHMPATDGVELTQMLRENVRFHQVPVVFVTATIQASQDVQRGYAAGALDFIFLPMPAELLRARVQAFLNQFSRQRQLLHQVRQIERLNAALLDSRRELRSINLTLEERVREQTAALRERAALLDQVPDAIVVRDLDGRYQYWNQGAQRVAGWTAAEALGRTPAELGMADNPARFAEIWRAVCDQGEWQGEVLLKTKAGATITVQAHYLLVRRADGTPQSVLSVATDITEKKALEAQFLQAQRLDNLGQLAGGIAHDLNNILTPILMAVSLLRERSKDADALATLNTVEGCAQRGADIVKQILIFSRGEAGQKAPLQLRHELKELARIVSGTFPKSITFTTSTPPDLWPVLGDATQLHQVLLNLCINARDAMSAGGALTVTAENTQFDEAAAAARPGARPGDYVLLRVRDTGAGIPPEILNRIFDPFFTTKEPGKGTGLGLSTVLGLVKSHGGFVEVDSQAGRGAEFRVFLPAAPGAQPAGAPAAAALPAGRGELILVVDDEARVRQTVQTLLQRHNYRVLLAADGVEALGAYVQNPGIRLVLVDLMMPTMNGLTLLRSLRRMNPQLKAIVATGLADDLEAQTVLRAGAHAVLHKPFASGTLLTTLRTALDSGAAIESESS